MLVKLLFMQHYGGSKAECKVIVTKPIHVKSISIPETFEMKNKSSETLELAINPENTTDEITPEWSSSNDKVAVVNENGTVTAKGEGEATITVKVGTFTAECKLTVGPAASNAEMAVNKKYNKALGKTVNVYPSRQNEGGTEKI